MVIIVKFNNNFVTIRQGSLSSSMDLEKDKKERVTIVCYSSVYYEVHVM